MTYFVKSFWISSLALLVGIIFAAFLSDNTLIHNIVDSFTSGILLSKHEMNIVLMQYARKNIIVLLLTISPSIIYLFYRIIKGMILANKNQFIPNLKSWL